MSYAVFKNVIEKETKETLTPEFKFHPIRKWRFDFAIERYKIGLEVDGGVWSNGRHNRGSGYLKDLEKLNTATSLGWVVLRFSSHDILKSSTIDLIKKTIKVRTEIV